VGRHRARYLLAADGLRSPIRQALGLGMPGHAPPRMGLRRHFSMSPAPRRVEVHWSPWAEAYVTPVAEDEVGLAFLWRPDRLPLDGRPPWERLLQGFPGLAERLGEVRSPLAGAGPFEQRARAVQRGPVLLLGDAAGYLDPLTGEGLRLGFAGAEAAVGCLLRGRPEDYGAQHARIVWRYWWMTSALLGLSGWSYSRRLLVPLCQRLPILMRLAVNALSEGS
jgi:flavin-dependent dehydrogenase